MKFSSTPSNEPFSSRLPSAAPPHPLEIERLASVVGLATCDRGGPDLALDDIAQRAATMCGTPFALVTLIREFDQIILGNYGVSGHSTERDEAICAHTILQEGPFVVEDLQADPRFSQLSVTTSAPYIRFYAGAPVLDANGLPLGSVCVLDTKPNSLDFRGLMTLSRFAAMAGAVLATRRLALDLLETSPSPSANETAMLRLDRILIPLFEKLGGARGHHS